MKKCTVQEERSSDLIRLMELTYIASKCCNVRAPPTFGFFSILCDNLDWQPAEPVCNTVQLKHRPAQGP